MSNFIGAPTLASTRPFLAYFRPNSNGIFPGTPFEVLSADSCFVVVDINSAQVAEFMVNNLVTLDTAIDVLFQPCFDWSSRIYTVHANSVLSRMVRWHAIKTGRTPPPAFNSGQVTDLVDAINRPAILTGNQRYTFKVSDYVHLLGLRPDPRYDRDTGMLIDLALRYGNNN